MLEIGIKMILRKIKGYSSAVRIAILELKKHSYKNAQERLIIKRIVGKNTNICTECIP